MVPERLKDDSKLVKRIANATKTYASTGEGDTRLVSAYLTSYVPAKMTGPDGLKHITPLISEVNGILARAGRSGQRQIERRLMGYVFSSMSGLAKGNYYPAARINAIVLLSQLDSTPANSETRTPPVPLKQTLPILIELYENESNVDGVRAAALHGIHRHVSLGRLSSDQETAIRSAMDELLASQAPDGRSELAHAYLQRFAVDILAKLSSESGDGETLGERLLAISRDRAAPDLIALYSAGKLAGLGEGLKDKVADPTPVLDSWMRRTFEAFEGELARLNGLTRPEKATSQPPKPQDLLQKAEDPEKLAQNRGFVAGGMGMPTMEFSMSGGGFRAGSMGMPSMSMNPFGDTMALEEEEEPPQPAEVIASRQKLNLVMQSVHLGATGHAAAASATPGGLLQAVPAEKQTAIREWIGSMTPVLESLNETAFEDLESYMVALEEQVAMLRDLVGEEELPAAEPESSETDVAGDPPGQDPINDLVGQ